MLLSSTQDPRVFSVDQDQTSQNVIIIINSLFIEGNSLS